MAGRKSKDSSGGGGKGNGNGNGNGNGDRRNRRVIPGVRAETLLGFAARRIYAAALANGRTGEEVPALANLAPLAEVGMNLDVDRKLELTSTIGTLRMVLDMTEPAVEILLISLASELDERIYLALLHLTQGVPGAAGPRVGGLLHLLHPDLNERSDAHHSLLEDAPLVRYHLVRLLGPKHSPLSQRELCAEASLLQHIVLNGTPEFPPMPAAIASVGTVVGPADADEMDGELAVDLGHMIDLLLLDPGPVRALHLRLPTTRISDSIARRLAAHTRRPIVMIDIRAVDKEGSKENPYEEKVAIALREAKLRNGIAMFVNPMQMDQQNDSNLVMRRNAQHWRRMLAQEKSVVVLASEGLDATDVDLLPGVGLEVASYELTKLAVSRRRELFELATERIQQQQPGGVPQVKLARDVSADQLATVYRVSEAEINAIVNQAAADARLRSLVDNEKPIVTLDDLQRAARDKTHRDVGKFARLVTSKYRWDDLILPDDTKSAIKDIYVSAKKRALVHEEWGYNKKHTRGLSLAVVFSGESGTGKTMAAEVLANELGVNLYQVDISSVVSKWIGETERHLGRIFDATENSDSILFFDEADALFGKRTQVNEAKDRYANLETSYLLQRVEAYSGIVILSTNLRSNIDEAFLRRLQYGLTFPKPDEDARAKIWSGVFPQDAPLEEIDHQLLASKYTDLSGGQIKLVAVGAAMLAAGEGRPITMRHVQRAYDHERQKMLRVVRDETVDVGGVIN